MCIMYIIPVLLQCGYFDSMFSGSWKESDAKQITLDIPDANIDADGKLTLLYTPRNRALSYSPAHNMQLLYRCRVSRALTV